MMRKWWKKVCALVFNLLLLFEDQRSQVTNNTDHHIYVPQVLKVLYRQVVGLQFKFQIDIFRPAMLLSGNL